MSLTEVNLLDITKKQYIYKLKAHIGAFTAMMTAQVMGFVFSLNGVGSSGTGSSNMSISIKYISGDMIVIFTMIWAFIMAITITNKPYRYADFTFVTNRLSSNLSTLFFLLTASVIGGVTAMLSGMLLKSSLFYYYALDDRVTGSLSVSPLELFIGVVVTILYLSLFSVVGYLFGMLIQLSKIFLFLLPLLFFGSLILEGQGFYEPALITGVFQFFAMESSLFLFVLKGLLVLALLSYASILVSSRMEVRT